MTKAEFLDKLRMALSGNVSDALVAENMAYYGEYIDSQIRMGQSELAVMESLGDPRLIARTIIQTNAVSGDASEDTNYRESESYGDNVPRGYYAGQNEVKVKTIPGWLWTIITILIIVCVLSFVFRLVSILLPIALPVLLILFLVKLFRDWLN